MSLAYYQTLLPRLIREQGRELQQAGDIDRAIASAVVQYSADAPRRLAADLTWPLSGFFSDEVPAGFTEDSTVVSAEFPVGEQPAALIGLAASLTPTGINLVSDTFLAAGNVVRITYTATHALAGGSEPADTIPMRHRDAVAYFAAHLLCRELATLYSAERESSIAADGSNTESRARNYAQRSKEFRAAYFATLGIADPMSSSAGGSGGSGSAAAAGQAAGAVVSWGSRPRSSFRSNDSTDWRNG